MSERACPHSFRVGMTVHHKWEPQTMMVVAVTLDQIYCEWADGKTWYHWTDLEQS